MKRALRIAALCALLALAPVVLYHGARALWYAVLFHRISRGMDEAADLAARLQVALAGHERADAVAAGPEGITVLLGTNPTGRTSEVWLQRLSWDGTPGWRRRVGEGQGSGRALARVPGGFVVAGERQWRPDRFQAELLRLDSAGRVVRSLRAGRPMLSGFASLAVLPDGGVLAGGSDDWTGLLVRTDSTLRPRWERRVDGAQRVAALAPARSGGFIAGLLVEESTVGVGIGAVRTHDAAGWARSAHRIPAAGRAEPVAVAALPEGGVLTAGDYADSARADPRMWIARTDAAGRPVWERTLQHASTGALAVHPDGGALLAGHTRLADVPSVVAVRLSARGETLWSRTLSRGAHDHISGIAPAPEGGWILAGAAYDETRKKSRAWILRLDSAGNTRWQRTL